MPARPLLIGRGPWAQKVFTALEQIGATPTICGKMTAVDCIREARNRGNDSVVIASAVASHAELMVEAFAKQLPVFCEKPFVTSVAEAEKVKFHWEAAGQPLVICDYVHTWTEGFERACSEATKHMLVSDSLPDFLAVFGGNVQRKDCHPVWDYGSHPIAAALLLGVDLEGLKLQPCECEHEWTLMNAHTKIHIGAYPKDDILERRYSRLKLHGLFDHEAGTWGFGKYLENEHKYEQEIRNVDDPPLQRALRTFLLGAPQASRPFSGRYGLDLPLRVTRVLESLCPIER